MAKQLKRRCWIYSAGVFLYLCMTVLSRQYTIEDRYKFIMFLVSYLVVGFDAFRTLSESLLNKKIAADYLMIVLATVGAFGVGRYIEAVTVMLLFELGMTFEAISTDKAKRSIAEMLDIRPAYAVRKIKGEEIQVDPSELKLRHIIIIKPGERIPVDAVITSGSTTIDTKALTGEAMPEAATRGDKIYSGCINLSGMIEARVVKTYEDSTVSRRRTIRRRAKRSRQSSPGSIRRSCSSLRSL